MAMFTQRGLKVGHNKRTSTLKPVRIDHCRSVTLLMKQHIGATCVPCVKPGDHAAMDVTASFTDANFLAAIMGEAQAA